MANKKSENAKKYTLTLEIEPPYTFVGVFTFMGSKDKGLAVTSKPIRLVDGGILHVGENGGIWLQTTKTGRRKKKDDKEKADGDE